MSSKSRKQKICSNLFGNYALIPMRNLPVGEGAAEEGRQGTNEDRIHIGDSDYTNRNHLGSLEQNEEVI